MGSFSPNRNGKKYTNIVANKRKRSPLDALLFDVTQVIYAYYLYVDETNRKLTNNQTSVIAIYENKT